MALVQFNINEAFERVYNVYTRFPAFFPKREDVVKELPDFSAAGPEYLEPQAQDGQWSQVSPQTGLVLWDVFVCTVPGQNWSYQLPVTTVVELRTRKNIVVTPLAGRDGTVKELIAAGDWELTFKGFLINLEEDVYPSDQVKEINRLYESLTAPRTDGGLMQAIPIASRQLNDLGIHNIVFTDLSFPPMAGAQNACAYELTALSDKDILLEIKLLDNAS